MDFICEEAEPINPSDDPYYGDQDDWYEGSCTEPEEPVRDTATIVNQLHCQEAQARKSDLQLACRLDELANSLRSGTPPNFNDDSYSPGQTLNEFLCVLEKRLLEKTQDENCQDSGDPECQMYCSPKSTRPRSPRRRKLNFENVTVRQKGENCQDGEEPDFQMTWSPKSSRSRSPRRKQLCFEDDSIRPASSTMRSLEAPTMKTFLDPTLDTYLEQPSVIRSSLDPHQTTRGFLEQSSRRDSHEIVREWLEPQLRRKEWQSTRMDGLDPQTTRREWQSTRRECLDPQATRRELQSTKRECLDPQTTRRELQSTRMDCLDPQSPRREMQSTRRDLHSTRRGLHSTRRECLDATSRREPPSSPDWNAMLNDSNDIICYPSERLAMYGKTAGDIWKERAEAKKAACKCPSPPATPVRKVQAIPVRCLPSPKFEREESLLSTSDMRRLEYCGCTVEEILRKKRAKAACEESSEDESPCWHHRGLDDSSFWKPKRKHHRSRKHSPCKDKDFGDDETEPPELSDSEDRQLRSYRSIRSHKTKKDDSLSSSGATATTSEEWLDMSNSATSMCCCDDLAQRVAEWTESHFGGQNDKGINAGIDCSPILDKKPLLKRKPTDSSYKTFISGVSSCSKSSPRSPRRPTDCSECSNPEVTAFMRERSRRSCCPQTSRTKTRYPKTPCIKTRGSQRKPTQMRLRLVSPPLSYRQLDDYEC